MPELKIKLMPSTEKCFLDDDIAKKQSLSEISMLKNERLSFQLAYILDGTPSPNHKYCNIKIDSPLADKISAFKVESVPVTMPTLAGCTDTDYLRMTPGLYPDLLTPLNMVLPLPIPGAGRLHALLFTVEDVNGIAAGEYPVTVSLTYTLAAGAEPVTVSETLNVTVIDAMLPEQELIHTQWFHNDCIATYYGCEIFSERHWELIGNYMEAAARCGINMILTPVLTPPLDTGVGHERPTVQLVDVTLSDGKYSFSYEKLDRYIKLALSKGMKYFEISHLFSQWGAKFAPKVMATVDGEYKRIFGWDTSGTCEEYRTFVRAFVAALTEHLRSLGVLDKCSFHISDEPNEADLEGYATAKNTVADLLEGVTIMDALSDYRFYEAGVVPFPIPCTTKIEPFLENNVPDLWTYYCIGQHTDVSNRFLAMPGQRTRVLGSQLFKYNIKGFLQWAFNFWYSQYSYHPVNPFSDTCGDYFSPAGDTFSVYPGPDGKALYSLHALHFYEALQDLRALRLLETKIGHDAVVALIEEDCAEPMTFRSYPRSQEYLLSLRERINAAIAL
ncbi:MAG: DUF4091 domain-containing protein [Clostridia bacterium]|nr:DUF4091 domain-containing protein [Clostridia bacterium]